MAKDDVSHHQNTAPTVRLSILSGPTLALTVASNYASLINRCADRSEVDSGPPKFKSCRITVMTVTIFETIFMVLSSWQIIFICHDGSLPKGDSAHQCRRPNNKNTELQMQQRSTEYNTAISNIMCHCASSPRSSVHWIQGWPQIHCMQPPLVKLSVITPSFVSLNLPWVSVASILVDDVPCESKKLRHFIFLNNFVKSRSILILIIFDTPLTVFQILHKVESREPA